MNKLEGPWDSNTNGCTVLGSLELWRLSILSDTVFCKGEEIELEVGGNNVTWYDDQNLGFPAAVGNTYSPTISSTATYYLTQTNQGIESPAYPITIHISDGPSLDLGPDIDLPLGDQVILNATVPGAAYLWSTGQTDAAIIVAEAGTFSVLVTDSLGCTASDTVVVRSLVSNEDLFDVSLQVFPNPASSQLTIDSPEAAIQSVQLYDLAGREILVTVNATRYEARIRSNFEGIALLKIQTEKGLVVRKIMFE